jgi:hypothetical protein
MSVQQLLNVARGLPAGRVKSTAPEHGAGLSRLGRQAAGGPIWFIVEDGVLIFNMGKDMAKAGH